MHQSQQQARLAAARLGHRQQVSARAARRQMHRHGLALVRRDADTAACPVRRRSDRVWQGQPAAGGGALQEDDVVARLRQVPQARQLAHVEQVGSPERPPGPADRSTSVTGRRDERIAGRERKRPVGGHQAIEPSLNRVRVCEVRRDDRQAELDRARVAAELGLDESRIDQLALSQPTEDDDAADDDGQCPRLPARAPKNQSPRDQASLTFEPDEIEADEAEQGERTDERWAGVGAPLLVQWPLERQTLVGARPVVRSRRQHDQLVRARHPFGRSASAPRMARSGSTWTPSPAESSSRSSKVRSGRWSPARSWSVAAAICSSGPTCDRIACREGRRMEGTENRLRIGRAELAGDAPQFIGAGRADQKTALVGVADDLQRHGLWRALASGYQRAEEVLG